MNKSECIKPGIILYFMFLIASCILFSNNSIADTQLDNELQHDQIIEKIRVAMDASYRMDYKRSEDIFNETITKWPDNPMPYLFKGGLFLNMFQNVSDKTEEKEVNRLKEQILFLNNKAIDLLRPKSVSDTGRVHPIAEQ